MALITRFPVELVAKVFEKMEVGDVWVARGVCRYWYDVFEYVAYASRGVYLAGTRLGVDVVCGISTPKGFQDLHVVTGELVFDSSEVDTRIARWVCEQPEFVYWPGGNWRMYSIGSALTEVNLHFKSSSTARTHVTIPLGQDVELGGNVKCEPTDNSTVSTGKFKDFALSIEECEEQSRFGKTYNKHNVTTITTPKWQIYALLAHHAKTEREKSENLCRHYLRSWTNIHNYSNGDERMRWMGASSWV
jgi:F-box domain